MLSSYFRESRDDARQERNDPGERGRGCDRDPIHILQRSSDSDSRERGLCDSPDRAYERGSDPFLIVLIIDFHECLRELAI